MCRALKNVDSLRQMSVVLNNMYHFTINKTYNKLWVELDNKLYQQLDIELWEKLSMQLLVELKEKEVNSLFGVLFNQLNMDLNYIILGGDQIRSLPKAVSKNLLMPLQRIHLTIGLSCTTGSKKVSINRKRFIPQ